MRLSLFLSLALVIGLTGCADEFISDVAPDTTTGSISPDTDAASLPDLDALAAQNAKTASASKGNQCTLTLNGPNTAMPGDRDTFSVSARNCDQISNLQWSVSGNATGQITRPNRYVVRAGQISDGRLYTVTARVFFVEEEVTGPTTSQSAASKASSTTLTREVYIEGPSDLGLSVNPTSTGFNVTWDPQTSLFCGFTRTCTLTTIYTVRGQAPVTTSREVSGTSFFDDAYVSSTSRGAYVRYRYEIDYNTGNPPVFQFSQTFFAEEAGSGPSPD